MDSMLAGGGWVAGYYAPVACTFGCIVLSSPRSHGEQRDGTFKIDYILTSMGIVTFSHAVQARVQL